MDIHDLSSRRLEGLKNDLLLDKQRIQNEIEEEKKNCNRIVKFEDDRPRTNRKILKAEREIADIDRYLIQISREINKRNYANEQKSKGYIQSKQVLIEKILKKVELKHINILLEMLPIRILSRFLKEIEENDRT